jgi:hypothetical protein
MADVRAVANGNWNTGATWNTGTVPTAADDVYSNTFTVNVDVSFTVLTLRSTAGTGITAGGSFNFNTAGVTGTVTSSSPLVPGATNLIQVTATTGTVTISLGGNVTTRAIASDILINYSGNCNLNLTGTNFNGGGASSSSCINKTSAGLITITGNVNGGNAGANTGAQAFVSTNGNTVIIGNVTGGIGATTSRAIDQSAGTLTITGNITGGQSTGTNQGVQFTGTSLTVNGTILGGTAAAAILTDAPINNITGNVTGGTVQSISSSTANIINVTGNVTASATAPAIQSTNANGQVYLNGNMVNNNGKMAIYAPIVWLDRTGTTQADFFTSGGVARTLYSEDTVPNTPAVNNVRSGTIYGAGNTLVGTIVMPTAANVRSGVVYDNGTTGTALFTTSLFLTELSSSTVPVAVRMQNLCTPMILGELMEAYKR